MFLIVSFYTPGKDAYKRMGDVNKMNIRKYAEKHNYEHMVVSEPFTTTRNAYWRKITLLREIMGKGDPSIKWIFWHDIDALITNHSVRLETLLGRVPRNVGLVVTKDYLGLNSGNFFIRCSPNSMQFLDTVFVMRTHKVVRASGFPEQKAMELLLKTKQWKSFVKWEDQRTFNSFPVGVFGKRWRRGDFLIHFAGIPRDRAAQLMEEYSTDPKQINNKYLLLDFFWWAISMGGSVACYVTTSSWKAALLWLVATQMIYLYSVSR